MRIWISKAVNRHTTPCTNSKTTRFVIKMLQVMHVSQTVTIPSEKQRCVTVFRNKMNKRKKTKKRSEKNKKAYKYLSRKKGK